MADAAFAEPPPPGTGTLPNSGEGPVPVPPNTKVGNMYEDYDPRGAMGGLFAPAYLKGFEPSEKALKDYYGSKNHISDAELESTRMPWDWMAPRAVNSATYGRDMTGANLPEYLAYGDKRGMMDRGALMAAAQSTPYDLDARRAQVAAKVAQNAGMDDMYRQQHLERYGYLPEAAARGPFAGFGGGDPRFGGPGGSGWREQQQAEVGQQLFPGRAVTPPSAKTGMKFMGFMGGG